ncbi:MAG TPA: hypothetical protein VHR88_07815 [Solirubrobacteraceae bacterium]|nr:hypothetical protein [Solirubrobacteraceae bacterium]
MTPRQAAQRRALVALRSTRSPRRALRAARRPRPRGGLRPDRTTWTLGVLAAGAVGAFAAAEVGRVWRRGSAPVPAQADNVVGAAAMATRETAAIAIEGFRASPKRDRTLLNLLASFSGMVLFVRSTTGVIRWRGEFGPFRSVRAGGRHVHHFVPGIVVMMLAGGASILSKDESKDQWLAIPFGFGAGLTLDESALLLELEDVYWNEEGIVSVQITLAVSALLASLGLATRVLRRGERKLLPSLRSRAAGSVAAA